MLWRKQSHGPRSVAGSDYLSCMWSVVETCRQRGRCEWDYLTACLIAAVEGHVLPLLLTPAVDAHAA